MICNSKAVSKIRPETQGEINMENGKGTDWAVGDVARTVTISSSGLISVKSLITF